MNQTTPRRWRMERITDRDHPEFKPRLRGWIHAVMAPLALAAGIVLVVFAQGTALTWATVVYAITGLLLFSVSATYHLVQWDPKVALVLKRLDHTNIMLVIAGTYTPLAVALLPPEKSTLLLILVWAGALGGVAFRLIWTNAPRWLYTPVYILLGLAALLYIGDFFAADPTAAVLVCVGGPATSSARCSMRSSGRTSTASGSASTSSSTRSRWADSSATTSPSWWRSCAPQP